MPSYLPSQRLPLWVRLVGLATLAAFVYMCAQVFQTSPSGSVRTSWSSGKWHDPMKDLINEPPQPLHRVSGDNYDPSNPNSDRINAAIVSLVRNSELDEMLSSMRDLERTWNHKFNYPWMLFNDEPFTAPFKDAIRKATNAPVSFYEIPREHWEVPPWIHPELYKESVKIMTANKVQFASKVSYHQMCRWNSGFFAHHPALKNVKYYWRVEPNVHFFCDIDYDVFRFMQDHNKTYGFTINLYDAPASIPSLWPETEKFLSDDDNKKLVNPNSAMGWLKDKKHRPEHYAKAGGFSTCHFWSNFEIGDLDFWRSEAYMRYFDHLDRAGGFFYERWGDAPVHSIALGLFADSSNIHWFRDIGYQHIPYFNCPKRPRGKCSGCQAGRFTDGEEFLYKEDCRPSWLEHVGMGEWEQHKEL